MINSLCRLTIYHVSVSAGGEGGGGNEMSNNNKTTAPTTSSLHSPLSSAPGSLVCDLGALLLPRFHGNTKATGSILELTGADRSCGCVNKALGEKQMKKKLFLAGFVLGISRCFHSREQCSSHFPQRKLIILQTNSALCPHTVTASRSTVHGNQPAREGTRWLKGHMCVSLVTVTGINRMCCMCM